jgi:hypothetical protein
MELISPSWLRTEIVKELERSVSKYKKERFSYENTKQT